jgi:hypothetical protein
MTNHARVGGILSIISGALGIIWAFLAIFIAYFLQAMGPGIYGSYVYDANMMAFAAVIYIVGGVICAILSILAIIGGAYALKRKLFGLALTGAIVGTLTFFPTGIPAIIFTSMGKPEFAKPAPPITPSPEPPTAS